MASFNKVILIGNLTRDPEVRFMPDGKAVATLGLAVSKKWRDASGSVKEKVNYVDVVTYGKSAENCGKYLNKGDAVLVEGELNQRRWDDKETGQKRSKMEVVGHVTFMPKRDRSQSSGEAIPHNVGEAFPDAQPVDEGQIPF